MIAWKENLFETNESAHPKPKHFCSIIIFMMAAILNNPVPYKCLFWQEMLTSVKLKDSICKDQSRAQSWLEADMDFYPKLKEKKMKLKFQLWLI